MNRLCPNRLRFVASSLLSFGLLCGSAACSRDVPEAPQADPPTATASETSPDQRPAPASAAEKPNVLLVTIDTLRADHCSAYGYPVATTPTLDALARRGTLFRRAYAPTATTSPSHAALMTSRHPRRLGVFKNGHVIHEDEVTLAEIFAEAGYATAAFVSSVPVRSKFGFGQGFEHYDENFTPEDASVGREKLKKPHDRIAGSTLREFRSWLSTREDERPLFLWVHFVDPHGPYRAPERFRGTWPKGTKGSIRRYDQEVRYADKRLGLLMASLHAIEGELGTIVLVTSDHGEGLGDHGWNAHGINLYEEAVRVPMVLSWRQGKGAVPRSQIVEEPVTLLDVAPTLVRLAGLEAPEGFEGVDLLGKHDPERPIHFLRRHYNASAVRKKRVRGEMFAILSGHDKYIEANEEDRFELYDLDPDPGELNNLAPKQRADAGAWAGRLAAWREAVPIPDREQPELSDEDLDALRALGYVD